jgi:DNA-binding CsgD family transcriptional regulator
MLRVKLPRWMACWRTPAPGRCAETRSPPEIIARAYHLTATELRVLLAIVDVGGVPESAVALGIAESTVKTHLGNLFVKTGARRPGRLCENRCGICQSAGRLTEFHRQTPATHPLARRHFDSGRCQQCKLADLVPQSDLRLLVNCLRELPGTRCGSRYARSNSNIGGHRERDFCARGHGIRARGLPIYQSVFKRSGTVRVKKTRQGSTGSG